MLYLEQLESRDLMDAALSVAFNADLLPALGGQQGALVNAIQREIAYIVQYSVAVSAIMGPQFAAANLPPVLNAAAQLEAFLPQAQSVFTETMGSLELALLGMPANSELLGQINSAANQLNMLTPLIMGL